MNHVPAAMFKDSLSDALTGNWPVIARLLMERPCLTATQNLAEIKGRPDALRSAIADCYEVSESKADVILRGMIHDADSFETSSAIRRAMSQFWTEISDADHNAVAGSREKLASILQARYGLSRKTSWEQIHQFFARHAR